MKLLVDMNLSPKWEDFLKSEGFEANHWSAVGAGNAPDSEIVRYAHECDYVILTSDLDFGTILAVTHGEKPSVVQLRSDLLGHDAIGKQVVGALHQLETELVNGALVTIESDRTRMRVLPLLTNLGR